MRSVGNKKRDVSTKATIDKEVGTGGDGNRSQRAKKNKKKSAKRNTTSLSKFGVTKSKKELRTLVSVCKTSVLLVIILFTVVDA